MGRGSRALDEISLYHRVTHSLRALPISSAQAAPQAKLRILLRLLVCLLLGAASGRVLKSNYAYYGLGFQTPSLFAECIPLQPFPSFILPDSPILQVATCAGGEQGRKAVTTRKTKVEREVPGSIQCPWSSQGLTLGVSVTGASKFPPLLKPVRGFFSHSQ